MKNIIEVVKTNKEVIVKRTLIVLGAIAGLIIASKVLGGEVDSDDFDEIEDDEDETGEENTEE